MGWKGVCHDLSADDGDRCQAGAALMSSIDSFRVFTADATECSAFIPKQRTFPHRDAIISSSCMTNYFAGTSWPFTHSSAFSPLANAGLAVRTKTYLHVSADSRMKPALVLSQVKALSTHRHAVVIFIRGW